MVQKLYIYHIQKLIKDGSNNNVRIINININLLEKNGLNTLIHRPRQAFSQEMKPSIDNSDYKKLLQVIENVLGNNYLSAEIAYRMREKYLLALI